MSFWTDIRPPRNVDDSRRSNEPRISRALRRLVVHVPAIVAAICAVFGLLVVADRHTTIPDQPIVREMPAPTTTRATLIDFNTATAAELATLPGIGAARAQAIVELRQQAPFSSLADLVNRGILRPSELLAIADLAAVYVPAD